MLPERMSQPISPGNCSLWRWCWAGNLLATRTLLKYGNGEGGVAGGREQTEVASVASDEIA
jgi:hypothetical protein